MKKTITKSEFIDEFRNSETYKNSFTYDGLSALYDYFERLEEDIGEEIELDIISICCEFSEYESALEAAQEYGYNNDEQNESDVRTWLEGKTTLIPVTGHIDLKTGKKLPDGVIIGSF